MVVSDDASTDGTVASARSSPAATRACASAATTATSAASQASIGRLRTRRGALHVGCAGRPLGPEMVERCAAVLASDPGVVLAYPAAELIDAAGARSASDRPHRHTRNVPGRPVPPRARGPALFPRLLRADAQGRRARRRGPTGRGRRACPTSPGCRSAARSRRSPRCSSASARAARRWRWKRAGSDECSARSGSPPGARARARPSTS